MTDTPGGQDTPPVYSPNGTSEAFKPNAAELIGNAVGQRVAAAIMQALPQALASVLMQVPVQVQRGPCGPCLARRVAWENRHKGAIQQAVQAAAEAAGAEPGSPATAQLDFSPFLPERLQPGGDDGAPEVRLANTTVNGTDVCAIDIDVPQAAAGSGLSVATVNPAALTAMMRGRPG